MTNPDANARTPSKPSTSANCTPISLDDDESHDTLTLAPYKFHQEDGRRDLEKMIILHKYPISMVERYGFRKYSKTLQSGFKVPSRNTAKKDIMQRYVSKKGNINALLRKKSYTVVTAHFINNAWRLQSRIIMFCYVRAPHTAENLDYRLSVITMDNCTTNDAMMDILHGEFPYGSLFLHGQFFHMCCCTHILNLIVQYGLTIVVADGVQRITDSVVFWNAFDKKIQKSEYKKMALGCKTWWNSSFEMFTIAMKYREVFVVLGGRDNLYKNPPNNEDWEKVEKICKKLEVFSTTTLDFSASRFPTFNIYFPKIFTLKLAISNWLSFPYAEREVSRISTFLCQLVEEYWSKNDRVQTTSSRALSDIGNIGGYAHMQEFAQFMEQDKSLSYEKSDLKKYLEASNVPLSRDILSILVSTIPSESAFSTSGGVLDPYRSRLLPESIEALMCAQNWIWANFKGSL
ncbi:hypothetical protein ES332_D08G220000v1 [Gossypium tomentosum]|uniref:HAT C-terminal dimerisation domain-containing protein n=1 Tax=Gossypium tomentosum TaxID=34277 RepID=A0A5D2JY73_GOSTO|nr:hypothetical protein ES332_D08G220000v1 [Gossypium tomentosum]